MVRPVFESTPPRSAGELEKVAYEVAVRALAQQDAALNELRSRAGTLLAAASLVASFIGGEALRRVGFDGWTVSALVTLAITLCSCIAVLWPRNGLIFALSGPEVFEQLYDFDMAEVHRRLAYWVQGFRAENQPTIGELSFWYRLAAVFAVVQVILWGGALASS